MKVFSARKFSAFFSRAGRKLAAFFFRGKGKTPPASPSAPEPFPPARSENGSDRKGQIAPSPTAASFTTTLIGNGKGEKTAAGAGVPNVPAGEMLGKSGGKSSAAGGWRPGKSGRKLSSSAGGESGKKGGRKSIFSARGNSKSGKKIGRPEVEFSFSPYTIAVVDLHGRRHTALLNALTRAGITPRGVKIDGKNLQIRIKRKELSKTFAICESMCYTYNIARLVGLPAFCKASLSRAGLLAGGLLTAAAMLAAGSFCLRVEIDCPNPALCRTVTSALSERGMGRGAGLAGIDLAEVRRAVNSVEGVAESTAELRGTTLVVRITERTAPQPPAEESPALLSGFDAVITRVSATSGRAAVHPGDIVRRGDLLIEGAEYGSDGTKLGDVPARGSVYGRVVYERTYLAAERSTIYRRTGRTAERTRLEAFGMSLGKSTSPFATFESERSSAVLNAFIPIRAERTTYYETERTEAAADPEALAAEYERSAREEYVGEAEELRTHSHIERRDGVIIITVYLEVERELAIGG